jgi:hypothetical protein
MPLTAEALTAIDLKPDELAEFLVRHLGAGTDLFALADLRISLGHQRVVLACTPKW